MYCLAKEGASCLNSGGPSEGAECPTSLKMTPASGERVGLLTLKFGPALLLCFSLTWGVKLKGSFVSKEVGFQGVGRRKAVKMPSGTSFLFCDPGGPHRYFAP